MKHVSRRLEQNYAEALASLGDPKNIYGALEETTQILLRNLKSRIAWKINDAAARNQSHPITLTAEMAELERIGRIHATLQDPRLIEFRSGDPDAGAREIVRILELARKEHGVNEQEAHKTTEGAEEAPEGMDLQAGDESRQKATPQAEGTGIERPPEPRHRIIGHGKVRRTSG